MAAFAGMNAELFKVKTGPIQQSWIRTPTNCGFIFGQEPADDRSTLM
jgi:hypothetical protein